MRVKLRPCNISFLFREAPRSGVSFPRGCVGSLVRVVAVSFNARAPRMDDQSSGGIDARAPDRPD
jgi:hypothetical protein